MNKDDFSTETWIERLASALPKLAKIQEPYLEAYQQQNPQVHHVYVNRQGIPPSYPLDDLRILYAKAYHSGTFGNAQYYAPLREVLDPVRHIMRSHPTLEQVVSPIIGKDDFLDAGSSNSGLSTSPSDLIAGLMARAAELSGDQFRTAAEETQWTPPSSRRTQFIRGTGRFWMPDYDRCYCFYGFAFFENQSKIADGMVVLPSEEARRFVDEEWIDMYAPTGAAPSRLEFDWRGCETVPLAALCFGGTGFYSGAFNFESEIIP